jgi:hypothetical protein
MAKLARSSNRGSKPGEHRGGRKKGTPNKLTRELKDMILGALEAVGGQEYFEKQARANATAFMTLVGKCLPHDVALSGRLTLEQLVKESHHEGSG